MTLWKKSRPISRRKFIDLGIQGSVGLGLSHALVAPLLTAQGCRTTGTRTVPGVCYHDCPDACSWKVTTMDGKVTAFEASTDNPFTAGQLCIKMDNFPNEVTYHPDRLLTPLKRIGKKGTGEFATVSWDEALNEVATRLKAIVEKSGGEAVLPYSYAGTEGLIQNSAMSDRFFAHIGATRLERAICGSAAVSGVSATNGQTTGVLPEDIVHSRHIILWGTNTVVSNQHLWPMIQTARDNGARLIVIDPFRSQTAEQADQHVQPLPGTDTALALSMIQVILAENLQDQAYVDEYTTGIEALREHVQAYHPLKAAAITGLDPETIIKLAREYAHASPSLIRVLIGLEHQANGSSAFRAIAMLPALIGAWRKLGGGLMHMTYEVFGQSLNWERIVLGERMESKQTRQINMIHLGRALTDPALTPSIRAMIVYNSNPAVIAPDQNKVKQGLSRENLFTVVLEHFLTDTARYADYVFPATTQLEHWDLLTSWGQTYINLNQPAIDPLGESKSNSEFFRLLAGKMGFEDELFVESDLDIIKATLKTDHPYMNSITFESLMETGWARLRLPEPWLPHATGNFPTPSGKCEFYSGSMKEKGLEPMPGYHPVSYDDESLRKYPLHLMTVKSTAYFLNSSHANVNRLRNMQGVPFLDMHATDAASRGITDGDTVRVFNQRGSVEIAARVKQNILPGVACMPQGFWPSLIKGGSTANALTEDRLTDLGGGAALHENRVQVEKV